MTALGTRIHCSYGAQRVPGMAANQADSIPGLAKHQRHFRRQQKVPGPTVASDSRTLLEPRPCLWVPARPWATAAPANQPLQRSIRIKRAGRADERRPSLAIQTWPQASDPPHKSPRVMAGHRLPSAARSDPWAQVADWCIAEQPAARVLASSIVQTSYQPASSG